MKTANLTIHLLLLLLSGSLSAAGLSNIAITNQDVEEQLVAQQIDLDGVNGSITKDAVRKCRHLVLDNLKKEDLALLPQFYGLRTLELTNIQGVDVLDLNFAPHLEVLHLKHTAFSNLRIEDNPKLEVLVIDDNIPLNELQLRQNIHLKVVELIGTGIATVDLTHNTYLTRLKLINNTNIKALDLANGHNDQMVCPFGPAVHISGNTALEHIWVDNLKYIERVLDCGRSASWKIPINACTENRNKT